MPLFSLFVEYLGGNAQSAGIMYATQFTSALITNIYILKLNDSKRLAKLLLTINYALKGFSWLMLCLFPGWIMLFVVQVLGGITQALGTPGFNVLITERLDKKQHIREWGSWDLVQNISIALGSIIGGSIAYYYGFTLLFLIMSVLSFFALALLLTVKI